MSVLTGYLTSAGTDLSNLFIPSGGGTFTGAITTNAGIIGPSTSISYSEGMIGYTVTVPTISVSISSGTVKSISNAFTIPIGVFLVTACVHNTYSGSGALYGINICLSTSNDSNTGNNDNIPVITSSTIPAGGTISGKVSYILTHNSSQEYYLNETISFATITSVTSSTSSYVTYTKIA